MVKIGVFYYGSTTLTLCHTILSFNDLKEEDFGKHCGKRRKCCLTHLVSKALATKEFPHNHGQNNRMKRMNPVSMTIVNPWREYWVRCGSNQLPSNLLSCKQLSCMGWLEPGMQRNQI